MNIPKKTQNLEFWQSRRSKFEEAKPTSKQRLCKHRCDADGFKVGDAGSAKSQILSLFRYKWLLFLFMLSLVSCDRYYVSVDQQKINSDYLASTAVGTPDPLQKHPPHGQELIVNWKIPHKLLKQKPFGVLYVIYKDYTEATYYFDIKYTTGYWRYSLLNEKFLKKKGILTYKAEILLGDKEEVYRTWTHQLFVNLIQL